MVQISHSRGPLAELSTPRFALIEVSVMRLSKRYLDPFETPLQAAVQSQTGFLFCPPQVISIIFLLSRPYAGLPTEQGYLQSSAPVPQAANRLTLPPQTGACSEGWNATDGWDRNTSSRLDTVLCDAEWPIVSALCIKFLRATLHEPFPILR